MTNQESVLIEPLIRPPMKVDENPIGYLIRVAEENSYPSYLWLSKTNGQPIYSKNPLRLYTTIAQSKWSNFDEGNTTVKDILSLPVNYFVTRHLRYCPLCLAESGYYKMKWQYRLSVACSEHQVWLHDKCHICESDLNFRHAKIKVCTCGADISESPVKKPSETVLKMQRYFDDSHSQDTCGSLILDIENSLSKIEKIKVLQFFSKWLGSRQVTNLGISHDTLYMETAKKCMGEVAETLFFGKEGFHQFLSKLHSLGYGGKHTNNRVELFIKFYRDFYSEFEQECFLPFKDYLEEYVNNHWEKPITRRNLHFCEKTIEDHPWITLRKARREFNLHSTEIRHAIRNKLLRTRIEQKKKRKYTLIYRPDLNDKVFQIRDLISAKEARKILGLTKQQFISIRDIFFPQQIKPEIKDKGVFSKKEITKYLHSYIEKLSFTSDEGYLSLSELTQHYGNQIDTPLKTILAAIQKGNLMVKGKSKTEAGLRSMMFAKSDFMVWYKKYKNSDEFISIPDAAKNLGLQQEFAYQLVNNGLIETEIEEGGKTRKVSVENINHFLGKYVILSKLSKIMKVDSRALISNLENNLIFSIDRNWKVKLRQKVYEIRHLKRLNIFKKHIIVYISSYKKTTLSNP